MDTPLRLPAGVQIRPGRPLDGVARALLDQLGQLRTRLAADIEREVLDQLVLDRRARADLKTIRVLNPVHHPVLAASGEVLARTRDLTEAELRSARKIDGIDGVVVISGEDPENPSNAKYRPNYVTPMGVVVKAACGPEPIEEGLPAPSTPSGGSVTVAVIDTGINAKDRTDGWLKGLERSDNVDRLYPDPSIQTLGLGAGHGTFVTGIIQQLAPGATVKVYNALKEDGLGTEEDVAATMVKAHRDGADIINLSLGLETLDDGPPYALEAAVKQIAADKRDVLMIAAAGNTGRNRPCWPGAFDEVIAVAGLTVNGRPASWSTRGHWVDCSTVGEGILSTYVKGTEDPIVDPEQPDTFDEDAWALWSGTSFAAPQITGAIAQLVQTDKKLTPRTALRQLLKEARPYRNYGRMLKVLNPGDLEGLVPVRVDT